LGFPLPKKHVGKPERQAVHKDAIPAGRRGGDDPGDVQGLFHAFPTRTPFPAVAGDPPGHFRIERLRRGEIKRMNPRILGQSLGVSAFAAAGAAQN